MEEYILDLIPDEGKVTSAILYSQHLESNNIRSTFIYSDRNYRFNIHGIDWDLIDDFCISINGEERDAKLVNNQIVFYRNNDNLGKERCVFFDDFGFVVIEIQLIHTNGEELCLRTGKISVFVKNNLRNNQVGKMVSYIISNSDSLLANRIKVSSRGSSSLYISENNVEEKLFLASKIADYYENNFAYFKANARYKTVEKSTIDYFEKLQFFTPNTIQFISTHPEYLRDSLGFGGIKCGNRNYYPEKTLISTRENSYDTTENRIILGFIKTVITELESMKDIVEDKSKVIPEFANIDDDYIHSASVLYECLGERLDAVLIKVRELIERFSLLWNLYRNTFMTEYDEITRIPEITATFTNITQYNIIYHSIFQWFNYGTYQFEIEKQLISSTNIPFLYEIFVLSKIISTIKQMGFHVVNSKRIKYESENRLFNNADCLNYFEFELNSKKIVVYYQPCISGKAADNQYGLELFRNNSYSLGKTFGYYYSPDFVLKYSDEKSNHYSIIDAKYKSFNNVQNEDVADLCYKYLFSLSCENDEDVIDGMYILFGRNYDGNNGENIYSFQRNNRVITPFARIIPVTGDDDTVREKSISNIISHMMDQNY